MLSSPYGQSSALWDLYRQHYGQDGSSTLVWSASSPDMNPTLAPDYLQRMAEDDPESYRTEFLGEFRAGLSTLIDPEALDAVVVTGRRELPPVREVRYLAFVDPSGGRSDAFTVAIGHRDDGHVIVEVVRSWPAPFKPDRHDLPRPNVETNLCGLCAGSTRRSRLERVAAIARSFSMATGAQSLAPAAIAVRSHS